MKQGFAGRIRSGGAMGFLSTNHTNPTNGADALSRPGLFRPPSPRQGMMGGLNARQPEQLRRAHVSGGEAGACGLAHQMESDMLKWALIFAVIALIAGGLGFTGVAGAAAGFAKILFFLFVIGFVIFIAIGIFAGRKIAGD